MTNPTSQKPPITVQNPSLPKGGGSMRGMGETFTPHEFSGSASLSIGLPASPCREITPELSLNYGSGLGNSAFGLDWNISLPDISRRTSNGIPSYTDKDTFIYSGGDYLVPVDDFLGQPYVKTIRINQKEYAVQLYLLRTESEFDKIERLTNIKDLSDVFWRVTDRNNTVSIFGKNPNSRIADPASPDRIFKWLLEEVYNTHGDHQLIEWVVENSEGLPTQTSRDTSAMRYPQRVCYGNGQSVTDGSLITGESQTQLSQVEWHFEIVFDYGSHNTDSANLTSYNPAPGKSWTVRKDPFSNYLPGFEVRTWRLCQNVLLFHRFENLGSAPVLTRVLSLKHQPSAVVTLLTSVQETGYQPNGDGSYDSKSLPPLNLGYTPFHQTGQHSPIHSFNTPEDSEGNPLVLPFSHPGYQMTDLYGEGIPGILYSDGSTVTYSEAVKLTHENVQYGPPKVIDFPISKSANDTVHQLADLSGNGQLNLLVSDPDKPGYYALNSDLKWETFTPFEGFPTDYHDPLMSHTDITGNGVADVLLLEQNRVRYYPSLDNKGFGPAQQHKRLHEVPESKAGAENETYLFGNVIGSGLSQRVRVTRNSVECWPNLGYGRFGQKVSMTNVPDFGPSFKVDRLLWADINGSGLSDLVYLYHDHVAIYLNQAGNGFTDEPINIRLPKPWDPLCQVFFADVLGNGTNCLVFVVVHPKPQLFFYNFNQSSASTRSESAGPAQKPYLLNQIDNSMGALTQITYASSARFYLESKSNGTPWINRLPFPVNVVSTTTITDQITSSSLSTAYEYAHGYYDPFDREFRGFGRVDRISSPDFKPIPVSKQALETAYTQAPVKTSSWYHTGAWRTHQALAQQYALEYWNGDSKALQLSGNDVQYLSKNPPQVTQREAMRSLYGTLLRSETYGLDGSCWQKNPYTVTQQELCAKELVSSENGGYPVFISYLYQALSYNYERNPKDPKVNHDLTLSVDTYGHILESCQVLYGRRPGQCLTASEDSTSKQQKALWITLTKNVIDNRTGTTHLLGVLISTQQFEITGPNPTKDGYFEQKALVNGLKSPNTSQHLIHWERHYFYDPLLGKELPLGHFTAHLLHHRTETVAYDKATLESIPAFPADLDQLLTTGGQENNAAAGGYISFTGNEQESQYYWNPGAAQVYTAPNKFCLPSAYYDPFQYYDFFYGSATSAPQPHTQYYYDQHNLLNIKSKDLLGNISQVPENQINYIHMRAAAVQDINGNATSVLFDPLGFVIATGFNGTQAGQTLCFNLNTYQIVANPDLTEMLSQPQNYLQTAGTYFYYDLDSWQNQQVPVHFVKLNNTQYNGQPASDTSTLTIQQEITYNDGFGRTLQKKTLYDGPQESYQINSDGELTTIDTNSGWLNTGAVTYNNQGNPIQKFEPFFTTGYAYMSQSLLNQHGVSSLYFYDALDRQVMVKSPEGFFSKTLFGQLETGVTSSQFTCYLLSQLYGKLGEQSFDQNGNAVSPPKPYIFVPSAWTSLYYDYNDCLNLSTYAPKPMANVDQDAFAKASQFINTPVLHVAGSIGDTVESRQLNAPLVSQNVNYAEYDVYGHVISQSDQRIKSFQTTHSLNQAIEIFSADSGTAWQLNDVTGNPLYLKNSRGFEEHFGYDWLQRLVWHKVTGGDSIKALKNRVKWTVYGDSLDANGTPFFDNPAGANLRGTPAFHLDEAGLTLIPSYNVLDQPLLTARWLRSEYKEEADWSMITQEMISQLIEAFSGKHSRSAFENLFPLMPAPLQRLLLTDAYVQSSQHDAIGRPILTIDADDNQTRPSYYANNWLKSTNSQAGAKANNVNGIASTPGISNVIYNARGQTLKTTYKNNVQTSRTYDPYSFRLSSIHSTRNSGETLQQITYHHDPSGNVTFMDNGASVTFFNNQAVSGKASYTYDALYRLIKATGREQAHPQAFGPGAGTPPPSGSVNPKAIQSYTQAYSYDHGGNLVSLQHQSSKAYTRYFNIHDTSNRLVSSQNGYNNLTYYTYDAQGNQLGLKGVPRLTWNYRNNLQQSTLLEREGNSDAEYYVYDSSGHRVRKVHEEYSAEGKLIRTHEVIYIGGIEVRRQNNGAGHIEEEWHLVQAQGLDNTYCSWRYLIKGNTANTRHTQLRYRLSDLLDSYTYELDEQGQIITWEQYYPFGGTSLVAGTSDMEVKQKYYRYSGKEMDQSTGLYYYGMRYYVPWLCRWTSTDPAGTIDGLNLYSFVTNNPVSHVDVGGMGKTKQTPAMKTATKMTTSTKHDKPNKGAKKTFQESTKTLTFNEGGETKVLVKSKHKSLVLGVSELRKKSKHLGLHGRKLQERRRLQKKYKKKVHGKTHESEHAIGFNVLIKGSGLKRGEDSDVKHLEDIAPAYQEVRSWHRQHIGTGNHNERDASGFSSAEYRDNQRALIIGNHVGDAIQLNQLGYAHLFQNDNIGIDPLDQEIALNSYDEMIINMSEVVYAFDTEKYRQLTITPEQKAEMYLARRAAITGKFPTRDNENEARAMFNLPLLN